MQVRFAQFGVFLNSKRSEELLALKTADMVTPKSFQPFTQKIVS
jgi:hypothetical protein